MKPTIEIDEDVFNPIYIDYLSYVAPLEIYYGGSSSGKSVFLADRCVLDVLSGGHNYLVVRKVASTIKRSSFNEISKSITKFGMDSKFKVNQSDMIMTCSNGYQIMFVGADDVEKLKSITPAKGVVTDIWMEEATEFDYADLQQLDKRLRGSSKVKKRIVVSFNPINQTHWIYTNYFAKVWQDDSTSYKDNRLSILKTTYRDNSFLTDDDIERLENTTDQYYIDVYLNGKWGFLGGVIFTNWRVEDLSEIRKTFATFNNAVDFGFASDPAAVVRTHYDRKHSKLYVLDEIYERGLTNDDLAKAMKPLIGKEIVVADSSEPKSIEELCQRGISAIPAIKGKDSVNYGIQWLKQQEIIIDIRCQNAKNEFSSYKWAETKHGDQLPKPVDRNNHCLTGDTIVNTLDGDIPICELVGKEGKVHCWDDKLGIYATSNFFDCRLTGDNVDVYEIELEDGRSIKATDYHPILTQRGWVILKDLTTNDCILDIHNHILNIQKQQCVQGRVPIDSLHNFAKIKSIKHIGKQNVYNMEVADHHNFSVNGGLIVHNCIDAIRYACQYEMVYWIESLKEEKKPLDYGGYNHTQEEVNGSWMSG